MEKKLYDICFVTFQELQSDARTLNFARTLIKNYKSVCVICISDEASQKKFNSEGINIIPIKKVKFKKTWLRWLHFLFYSRRRRYWAKAKIYLAGDVFSLFAGAQLKNMYHGKLFYDSREIYSALASLSSNPFKQKIISKIEKHFLKNIDKTIVSGKLDAEYLQPYFNINIPYHVIMNLPPFTPVKKSNFLREKYNIPEKTTIIIYQGMIMKGRGIIKVLQAMTHLKDYYFVIVGEGDFSEQVRRTATNLQLENRVILTGLIPYDELLQYTASADIGTVLIEPISFSYKLALPNKLFEYCMSNLPSLISDLPAMHEIIKEYKIGKLISTDANSKEIAQALQELKENKEEYIAECKKASQKYNYETQEEIILKILE